MATADPTTYRRALIAKMLAEGTSGAPVQHWTQGVNRLAQALVGGMGMGQLRAEDAAAKAKTDQQDEVSAALFQSLPGLGPTTNQMPPMSAAPQSVQRVSLAGQPDVPADVPTLEPQQTRGVIQGNLSDEPMIGMSVQPTRVAQALQPQMPPQGPQIPPQVGSVIRALGSNPKTRKEAISLYSQYLKPQETPDALRIVGEMRRNPQAYGFSGPDDPALKEAIQSRLSGRNTTVTVDQRGESEFNKVGGKLDAERFDAYIKAGDDARNVIADLDSLREIGSRITTGKTAEVTAALGPYAEMLGVKIDTLPDLQAYKSIVAKMAPRMRPPGSGATSDFDLRQYIEALPGLGKTPEGNEIIANTNKALAEHRLAVSAIAEKAIAKELTRSEATKQIRELPDPLELWRKARGKSPAATSETTKVIDGKSYFKRNGQWFEGSP
jgi:hypothetical protein